ncbi:MAG: hypothetical protein IJ999_00745, partial [Clostridia bacterium]|nr:hypothetical protein [Clostridia bacterium]
MSNFLPQPFVAAYIYYHKASISVNKNKALFLTFFCLFSAPQNLVFCQFLKHKTCQFKTKKIKTFFKKVFFSFQFSLILMRFLLFCRISLILSIYQKNQANSIPFLKTVKLALKIKFKKILKTMHIFKKVA